MAYASKYYDPVKAREYYEKHKKLKGQHSTKGMTNSQKEMAAYVKDKLSAEKKQKLEGVTKKAQEQRADVTAAAKAKREMFAKSCSNIITSLRTKLQNMNPDQKKFAKQRIQEEISKVRETYTKRKAGVTSDAKNQRNSISASAKTEKANIRTDYNNKYAEALKDIRKNAK